MKKLSILLFVFASILLGSLVSAQDEAEATVNLGGNDELGAFLVGADGLTLYIFTNDEPGVSNCTGGCAENWPPLTIEEGEFPTLGAGVSGVVRAITREDGTRQVTYNGQPLYYWVNDAAAGDTTGHTVGDVWYVAATPQVGLAGNDELGAFLVGADGMTLYIFTNDEPGVSNCTGGCAANWPPLTVDSEEALTLQPGLVGEFGLIETADGDFHVTLDDMPLYYWVNDSVPGDATGHTVGDVWYVATVPTIGIVEDEDLGEILVGGNGFTLYIFTNDEPGVSNCTGGCAANWPPLTVVSAEEIVVSDDIMGAISLIERADGTLQVAYNDAPLYYWVNDIVAGDTNGNLVGDVWFAAQP